MTLLGSYLFQKIYGRMFGRRGVSTEQYRFKMPDFSEIGIVVKDIKKITEDINEIKRAISGG